MITCILLSAGLSSRFGSPKALAKFKGRTVIEHLQKTLLKTQAAEIIVVLGANAQQIQPFILKHTRIRFVYNKDYNLGQTSSFKAGLQNVSSAAEGIMLLPVDYPLIKKETFEELIKYFLEGKLVILVPTHEGRKGHPPLFSSLLKKEFFRLKDSLGINTVIQNHPETVLFPVSDHGVIQTFNTKEEWERQGR